MMNIDMVCDFIHDDKVRSMYENIKSSMNFDSWLTRTITSLIYKQR